MNFVAVQHSITDETVYINLAYVTSFIYYKDDNVTRVNMRDGVVNVKGNIAGEVRKYILAAGGHFGAVVGK